MAGHYMKIGILEIGNNTSQSSSCDVKMFVSGTAIDLRPPGVYDSTFDCNGLAD